LNEQVHCRGGITLFSWSFLGVFPENLFSVSCVVLAINSFPPSKDNNQLAKFLWSPKKPMVQKMKVMNPEEQHPTLI
jgi:hypothetical protein